MNFPLRSPHLSIRTALTAGMALAFTTLAALTHASDLYTPASALRARPSPASAPTPAAAPAGASKPTLETLPRATATSNAVPPPIVSSSAALLDNAELDAQLRETPALEARLKNEQLKRDIRKAQHDSSTNTAGMPPADALPSPIATGVPVAPVKLASDWVLVGTGAYDGRQIATISVNGAARDVRVGESIDGWTVKSIAAQRVTLGRGRSTKTVSM